MSATVLTADGNTVASITRDDWEAELRGAPEAIKARLAFMTPDHHRVRRFAVEELPRRGEAITIDEIALGMSLPSDRVAQIVAELERALFFVVRTQGTAVSWAFPVTIDGTPHRLAFSTGERCFAAGAEDAIAAPFVEGRLRQQTLSVDIQTRCAHCDRDIAISIDSELHYEGPPDVLVFEPSVDWSTFTEPNIIHHYGQRSVFFWSEEHAREYRKRHAGIAGLLLTLDQSVFSTRIAQSALFAF